MMVADNPNFPPPPRRRKKPVVSAHRFNSKVELRVAVVAYSKKSCKVPPEFDDMIKNIVHSHLISMGTALGNLELCYLRTKQHADEL